MAYGKQNQKPKYENGGHQLANKDIRPPMEDNNLRSAIKEATQAYSDRKCEAVRLHISNKTAKTHLAAATRSKTDLNRAKEIADKQLSRQLGLCLDHATLDMKESTWQHLFQTAHPLGINNLNLRFL